MPRYQANVTVGRLLREAILFSAQRDGLAASTKMRQLLTQALARTMDSKEFREHYARVASAELTASRGPVDDEK